jgi:hypothetical protein
MRAPSPRYNVSAATGNADGLAAASTIAGNAVDTSRISKDSLSALVTVDCETSTMTLVAKWQVSNDNSTYVDVALTNNAANVTLATGTSGADATVTKAIVAPGAVFGWNFARLVLVTGVAQGTTSDTYSIGYCYRTREADVV